ncbi:MAG: glycine cleavage system aminomethyltransferase GcvT [Vulcanimicrobiaceae bacterium]
MNAGAELVRTALYDEHRALGARIVPFAGFAMPVQYRGIIAEHDAVRARAGLFDLSHMAQFELEGEGAAAFADELVSNAVASMKPFQARYNLVTNERGGTRDDVLFYRLGERFLVVANAANGEKIVQHFRAQAERRPDVRLRDLRGRRALLAVQGPRALEIVAPFCEPDLAALRYYFCLEGRVDGVAATLARTGYTGEDGFELFVPAEAAPELWRKLLAAGAAAGLVPCGLGARDMLRLEAGMPLYGFELSEDLSPLAGGQGWAVKFEKPRFVGREALLAQAAADTYARIAGVVLDGPVPARTGYPVFLGERRVGEVRSASVAPSCGGRPVATVLVSKEASVPGSELAIEIRGQRAAARVVPLPFYKRAK